MKLVFLLLCCVAAAAAAAATDLECLIKQWNLFCQTEFTGELADCLDADPTKCYKGHCASFEKCFTATTTTDVTIKTQLTSVIVISSVCLVSVLCLTIFTCQTTTATTTTTANNNNKTTLCLFDDSNEWIEMKPMPMITSDAAIIQVEIQEHKLRNNTNKKKNVLPDTFPSKYTQAES